MSQQSSLKSRGGLPPGPGTGGSRLGLALALVAAFAFPAAASTWDHAHGDAANSGFANVLTAPAVTPSATVPNLETFAPGAGPVIGLDGTVYVGNEQGELRAFHLELFMELFPGMGSR